MLKIGNLVCCAISDQIFALFKALSNNTPLGCPMGQIKPKLRIDAPTANSFFSKTATFRPFKAEARANASPKYQHLLQLHHIL